jgi:hypothetical protein
MSTKSRFFAFCTLIALLVAAFSVTAQELAPDTTPIFRFADGSNVEGGWSTLSRLDNGLAMTFHTDDLTPGDAYTVWWVIFNAPQNCTDGVCNEDDLFVINDEGHIATDEFGQRQMDPAALENAQISIQYATGSAIDDDGIGDFAAAVGTGEVPGIVLGPGLVDPQTAEVHLVVRTHGPVVKDLFDAQISSFGGGCEPMDAAPCADVQFTMHQPS